MYDTASLFFRSSIPLTNQFMNIRSQIWYNLVAAADEPRKGCSLHPHTNHLQRPCTKQTSFLTLWHSLSGEGERHKSMYGQMQLNFLSGYMHCVRLIMEGRSAQITNSCFESVTFSPFIKFTLLSLYFLVWNSRKDRAKIISFYWLQDWF